MRRTSRWLMPALSLVLFFGAVGVAQAAGWWTSSGRVEVVAGDLTSDEVKGWMTLGQAAEGLGVPVEDLVDLIGAPADSAVGPDTVFKDVEGLVPDFELTTFREKVQAYLDARTGTAPTPTGTAVTAVPSPAATAPAVPTAPATSAPTTHVPTGTPTGTPAEGIRGSMTVRQVAEASGVEVSALLAEAGLPVDLDPDTVLRDIQSTVPGFEVQTIRDAVAALGG